MPTSHEERRRIRAAGTADHEPKPCYHQPRTVLPHRQTGATDWPHLPRNSRGVSQFEGKKIGELILNPQVEIDAAEARTFLERIIAL